MDNLKHDWRHVQSIMVLYGLASHQSPENQSSDMENIQKLQQA